MHQIDLTVFYFEEPPKFKKFLRIIGSDLEIINELLGGLKVKGIESVMYRPVLKELTIKYGTLGSVLTKKII